MKSGKGGKHVIREFITDGDSDKVFSFHLNSDDLMGDKDIMIWNDKDGEQ